MATDWLSVKGKEFGSEVSAAHHDAAADGLLMVSILGGFTAVSVSPCNLRKLADHLVKVAASVERAAIWQARREGQVMESDKLLTVTVVIREDGAYALAELCKRIGWSDCRKLAVDDTEAGRQIYATDRVRAALLEAGIEVR